MKIFYAVYSRVKKPVRTSPKLYVFLLAVAFVLVVQGFTNNNGGGLPASDPDNGGLFLPDGFEAVVVIDSIKGRTRHIAVNDNGDLYVKLRFPDSIGGNMALRDTDMDGKADLVEKFANYDDKGSYGTAMRVYKGYLYFSSETKVFRQKLTPGKLVPEGPIELVLADDHPHGRHEHIAKPITFDDKGNMYVPFGANSNNCQESNRTPASPGINPCPQLVDHGGIWRFKANKLNQTQKDGTKYATGLRSVVALDWNHDDNTLYALQHGRDDFLRLWSSLYTPWQSAVFPSEELLKITEGSDSGWPYYYYDQIQGKKLLNPEYGGDGKKEGKGAEYNQPLIGFPAHWAPNDIMFYTGSQFPDRYKNGAFIAFHGSTNRAPYPQAGYFIAFVPFKNGAPSGPWEVFADGFAKVDPIVNVKDAVYRPMGIAKGPDGSLYISDTEKGKIWRIMFKGNKKTFSAANLTKMEKRKELSHIRTPDIEKDNLEKGVAVAGAKIYNLYCGTCHQRNGKGDGNRFPPLTDPAYIADNDRLIRTVLNGLEGPIQVEGKPFNSVMPQHSFLKDEELAEVLTYVRQNFGNSSGPITREEVATVRRSVAKVGGK